MTILKTSWPRATNYYGIATCAFLLLAAQSRSAAERPGDAISAAKNDARFSGDRAYEYLKQVCAIGPRPSGSEGMRAQQAMLRKHFEELGAQVSEQRFRTRHPLDGSPVDFANLIVEWNPEKKERVLICAHYDTRPRPDNELSQAKRENGVFVGANDGASGTALLMELAHQMSSIDGKYGVDFVLFDGEELVFGEGPQSRRESGRYFLGSEWFAREYVRNPPEHTYRWGVLVDMVGDADLQIFQERHSMRWSDTRPLVAQIWGTAARLGVEEFIARPKYEIRDDHLPLRNIARIPTCDIIDFDYPDHPRNRYWHTEADTPDKCSAESLGKVGAVLQEWLKTAE